MPATAHYAVLGLGPDASDDEVKRAYRHLSRRYHPDTAGTNGEANTAEFIRITQAYHSIIDGEKPTIPARPASPVAPSPPRRKGRKRRRLGPQFFLKATLGLALVAGALVTACLVISEMYSRRVMLRALHDGGVAFVPPATRYEVPEEPAALTFAEKLRRERETAAAAAKKVDSGKKRNDSGENVASTSPAVISTAPAVISTSPAVISTVPAVISTAGRDLKQAMEKTPAQLAIAATTQSSRPTPAVISTAGRNLKPVIAATTPSSPTVQPAKPPPADAQLQQRLDSFLAAYCQAYGARNLTKFKPFFTSKATENGTPITDLMPTYTKLFASTDTLTLQISPLNWHQPTPDQIALNGRFTIDLIYKNAEDVHGEGKIDFQLAQDGTSFHIQKMTYSFDQ